MVTQIAVVRPAMRRVKLGRVARQSVAIIINIGFIQIHKANHEIITINVNPRQNVIEENTLVCTL
jgi:hypothetical protein